MDARAQQIFESALEVPEAQRATFVKGACGDDAALRLEVESLLDTHRAAGEFLGEPTISTTDTAKTRLVGAEQPGTQIGPYKLLELIGEGGFGSVYLAEQRTPVVRRVALKIIKLGMDTRQVVARFEQERQALAMMDHPNIAKVLEAGATESGRPYFVMELVRGVPITDYCKSANLSTRDRLELLIPVCHAVQHAHQKGIIHRDIKPSNILVSLEGNQAVPKIIDFGIAKATNARLTELTLITEQRSIVGTPMYMSPEQANLSGLDVDTRTDIYSLGVLLYELLTGTTPFDSKELLLAGYAEIQRIIREVDPPRPSTRMESAESAAAAAATAAATATGKRAPAGTRRLSRTIRGELDWIVMKAMEKDRRRRYETAGALAADIERYLAGQTIAAAPPSARYRVHKFVARNRLPVAFVGSLLAALLIGFAGTVWQYRLAAQRAQDAAREAARNQAVVRFVVDSLQSQDPFRGGARAMTIAAAMKIALAKLDNGELAEQPATRALLLRTIAEILRNNNELEAANDLAERALALERELHPGDHLDVAASLTTLAQVHQYQRHNAEAEALYTEALAMLRRILPADHLTIARRLSNLGSLRFAVHDYPRAKEFYTESLAMKRRLIKGADATIAEGLIGLASALAALDDAAGAEKARLDAANIYSRLGIGDDPIRATLMWSSASARINAKDLPAAERLATSALKMRTRIFPEGNSDVIVSLLQLAKIEEMLDRLPKSQQHLEEAADMAERILPEGDKLRKDCQKRLADFKKAAEERKRLDTPQPAATPDR